MDKKKIFIIVGIIVIYIVIMLVIGSNKDTSTLGTGEIAKVEDLSIIIDEGTITNLGFLFEIENHTIEDLKTGMDFEIQRLKNDEWKKVDLEMDFVDTEITIASNATITAKVDLEDSKHGPLAMGEYRIVKKIGEHIVASEFKILN